MVRRRQSSTPRRVFPDPPSPPRTWIANRSSLRAHFSKRVSASARSRKGTGVDLALRSRTMLIPSGAKFCCGCAGSRDSRWFPTSTVNGRRADGSCCLRAATRCVCRFRFQVFHARLPSQIARGRTNAVMTNTTKDCSCHKWFNGPSESSHDGPDGVVGMGEGDGSVTVWTSGRRGRLLRGSLPSSRSFSHDSPTAATTEKRRP